MGSSRTDKLLATALRLAQKYIDEEASAEDLEKIAITLVELDEAIVLEGARLPKRWAGASERS